MCVLSCHPKIGNEIEVNLGRVSFLVFFFFLVSVPLSLVLFVLCHHCTGNTTLQRTDKTMSDSLQVVVVASPFAGLAPLYEVDPDADALVIVPPQTEPFAPWEEVTTPTQQKTTSTTAAPPASRPGLRIKVSSKHLSFASKIFKSKLKYAGGQKSKQSDGRIHLQLAPEEQFDSKAVAIVLNALHGKGSKVPKEVDLDTLGQIALFVDKFQLFDAVEVYGERWISRLEQTIPDAYNRDLIVWLYISYVFRNAEVLRGVTKTAIVGSDGPIKTLGLPIRDKLISKFLLIGCSPKANTNKNTSTSNANFSCHPPSTL